MCKFLFWFSFAHSHSFDLALNFFLSTAVTVVKGEFWTVSLDISFFSTKRFPWWAYFCWQLLKSVLSLSLISPAICIKGVLPFPALSMVTHPSAASSLLQSQILILIFCTFLLSLFTVNIRKFPESGKGHIQVLKKIFFLSLSALFLIPILFVLYFSSMHN